ncbi:MAG TPA: hypothetical protein VH206_04770 [Xanthobacteraceae bacterium]|jgi:hypothetical protein|nr:hypothetical protein [Xanthobacteraceae bacterium]
MSKSPAKAAKWAARSERLAVALRENLKRRKARARQRGETRKVEEAGGEAEGASQPEFRRNRTAQ